MKYIKTYDSINIIEHHNFLKPAHSSKYQVGDYVFLDVEAIKSYDIAEGVKGEFYDSYAIICYVNTLFSHRDTLTKGAVIDMHPYDVEYYNDRSTSLKESEIIRKMTPEEIDIFNLKKEAHKYNI